MAHRARNFYKRPLCVCPIVLAQVKSSKNLTCCAKDKSGTERLGRFGSSFVSKLGFIKWASYSKSMSPSDKVWHAACPSNIWPRLQMYYILNTVQAYVCYIIAFRFNRPLLSASIEWVKFTVHLIDDVSDEPARSHTL